jgi:pimeloyl-ACP methyl ester carboxylesterase
MPFVTARVEDIVRHFGLRDLLLAGHSMGASTALHCQRAGGFARELAKFVAE